MSGPDHDSIPSDNASLDETIVPGPVSYDGGHELDETLLNPAGGATEQTGDPRSGAFSHPRYQIESVLGRGGMGGVYQARDTKLKRSVALKMILGTEHAGPEQFDRFRIEAETIARLVHPNIVQIYEIGDINSLPFVTLELVGGGDLREAIETRQPNRSISGR